MSGRVARLAGFAVISRNIVSEALASLKGRRLQAALSSFGIATGIAAVVLLVSIVSGIHRFAVQQVAEHEQPIIRTYLEVEDIARAVEEAEAAGAVIAYGVYARTVN
jgi:hypothetical protein